jgi:hypothetical protein
MQRDTIILLRSSTMITQIHPMLAVISVLFLITERIEKAIAILYNCDIRVTANVQIIKQKITHVLIIKRQGMRSTIAKTIAKDLCAIFARIFVADTIIADTKHRSASLIVSYIYDNS